MLFEISLKPQQIGCSGSTLEKKQNMQTNKTLTLIDILKMVFLKNVLLQLMTWSKYYSKQPKQEAAQKRNKQTMKAR